MHFLLILQSGASVKNVAFEFVEDMLQKSWQQDELSMEVTCDFVNDILQAIGLDCTITPEQIDDDWSYVWPMEQIQIYNFHYVEASFTKLEEFLREVCALTVEQNDIYRRSLNQLESPVDYLMQLIAVWCSVYKQLIKMEDLHTNKRFEEPLARINFHLLLGMHEVRKLYLSLLLDAICNRLYWSAVQGLFYKQTHEMTFNGLLLTFSKDYDLFHAHSAKTMNFFYEAFSVEIYSLTPLILYETLQNMLQDDVTSHKLNILSNFLIEPYMLRVYFTTISAKKYMWYNKITIKIVEKIQQAAIKFLNILQSKLLSLDCFTREFMEAILNLVFKKNESISTLACTLYITMMKRKISDDIILKHIMDFYVAHVGSIKHLKPYVEALHGSFEFLLNFSSLLELITDYRTTTAIRLLSAHILVIVFELKLEKKDSANEQQLQHLLQILPEIFENLNCQSTEGILLKIYDFIAIKKLPKQIIDNFIHYAVGIFTYTDSPLEYPLLMNIFSVFHKCLMYTKEWQHLELITDNILIKYNQTMYNLKQIELNKLKPLSQQALELCNGLLKRFNIIMKTKYSLMDGNHLDVIRNFSHFFLYNSEIKSLILEGKSLIDLYALEIVISCILQLLKLERNNRNYTFNAESQELFKFLWLKLKNLDELLKFPIVRSKTYFCCFTLLIIHLNLKLDVHVYINLVQILIMVNFKNKLANNKDANELQQLHPLQSLKYQHLMFRLFEEMHKYQGVQINSNTVWKLCIYYGMFKDDFQEDLKNLLITLANYRFQIYKHIMPVLIYNLYKQTPALHNKTIISILKRHKHLIDNDIKVESSQLLKVHVVLLVIQILEKALSVQCMKTGHNRLEALKHLNIFIEDLDLNQLKAQQLILEALGLLEKNLMGVEERKVLSDFTELLHNKACSAMSKQYVRFIIRKFVFVFKTNRHTDHLLYRISFNLATFIFFLLLSFFFM